MVNSGKKLISTSLRTKIIASLLVVSLIPIIIVGSLSIGNIELFSMREMERTSIANLTSACESLKRDLVNIRVEAIRPSLQENNALEVLRIEKEGKQVSLEQAFKLQMLLTQVTHISQIHSIYVFGAGDGVYTNRLSPALTLDMLHSKSWFTEWLTSSSLSRLGEPIELGRTTVIPFVRIIMDMSDPAGICVVNIYESALYETCRTYGRIITLNNENTILTFEDKSVVGSNFYEAFSVDASTDLRQNGHFTLKYNGESYNAVCYNDSVYDIRMIELLSQDSPQLLMDDMFSSTTTIMLICTVVCVILSLFLSGAITKPLHRIRSKIDTLQLESLEPNMRSKSNDEIGMLINSINNMAQRITSSKEELFRMSEEMRRAEYRAIELQINPHFLYNTLSTINYLTDRSEHNKVKQVVEALSTLFRISVNSGREQVRIKDEIRHVQCYLEILSIRHESEFSYQIDIEPSILDYYMIKILLQPLVENAIQHGIREGEVKGGFIRITAYQNDERVVFEVADNGKATQEKIEELNRVIEHEELYPQYGIGMLNVHKRVSYYYNHDFGLSYSKRNGMTVARIEIPVCKGEGDVQFFGSGR